MTKIQRLLSLLSLVFVFSCTSNEDEVARQEDEDFLSVEIMPLSYGYSKTSINTSIYRCNSIASDSKYQVVAYYNERGNIVIAKRFINSKEWNIKETDIWGDCTDAHNSISIALDGDGYIHLSYAQHGNRLKYRKSLEPYSRDFGDLSYMIDSVEEQRVTYPEFYRKNDGNLIFAYRSGYSGDGNLVLNEYDVIAKTWTRKHDNLLDGENARNAYWQMYLDNNDAMFLSWVWRETPSVETNHDLCYAYSKDLSLWRNSKDEFYMLPITLADSEVAYNVPQNSELINQTSMAVDRNGNPYIATYWRDSSSVIPQYRVVWNDGVRWQSTQIGERVTPFSLSGMGTKRIPISRPKIVIGNDNKAFFMFRDIERGEVASMAYCKDIRFQNWNIVDLTDFSVEAWEPTIDMDRWKKDHVLDIYVQKTFQGDGETSVDADAQKVYIVEVKWTKNFQNN